MPHQKTVCILVPAYNEEKVIEQLFIRLRSLAENNMDYKFDILFVNDGSTDKTLDIIKQKSTNDQKVSYINLSRNFGKEAAMIAGLDHADSDATVIIDADLQDPPELIPEMIRYWEQGYDDVYAKRNKRAGESRLKKITSKLFYKVLQKSTSINIQRDTGDFRLLDKRCVAALRNIRESQRYTKGMFSWIGFKKKELLYDRDPRAAGTTKWNYLKLINLAIEGITSFTTAPLRLSSFLGVFISVLSFLYIIVLLVRTLLLGSQVAGYPSIMAVMLFLGGVQLMSLGIIGEYISRIFNETKQRPIYIIEELHRGTDADIKSRTPNAL